MCHFGGKNNKAQNYDCVFAWRFARFTVCFFFVPKYSDTSILRMEIVLTLRLYLENPIDLLNRIEQMILILLCYQI